MEAAQGWTCSRCTLVNDLAAARCSACDLRAPRSKPTQRFERMSLGSSTGVTASTHEKRRKTTEELSDLHSNGAPMSPASKQAKKPRKHESGKPSEIIGGSSTTSTVATPQQRAPAKTNGITLEECERICREEGLTLLCHPRFSTGFAHVFNEVRKCRVGTFMVNIIYTVEGVTTRHYLGGGFPTALDAALAVARALGPAETARQHEKLHRIPQRSARMSWEEAKRIAAAEGLTFVQHDRSNSGYLGVCHQQMKRGLSSEKGSGEYLDAYSATVTRKRMDKSLGAKQSMELGNCSAEHGVSEQVYLGQYGSIARAALEVARALGSEGSAMLQAEYMAEKEQKEIQLDPAALAARRERALEQAAAEGLKLLKSDASSSGYRGVAQDRSSSKVTRRFFIQVADETGCRRVSSFPTPEEAALALARLLGPEEIARIERDRQMKVEGPTPQELAALEQKRKAALAAAAAEGLTLETAPGDSGFKAVYPRYSNNQLQAMKNKVQNKFRGAVGIGGRQLETVGIFDTAEEAALAVARYLASPDCRRPKMANDVVPMTAAEVHEAAAAEGLTLIREPSNNFAGHTGFKGVRKDLQCTPGAKRFVARLQIGHLRILEKAGTGPGRNGQPKQPVHLGSFHTAEEAALAFARALGPRGCAAMIAEQEQEHKRLDTPLLSIDDAHKIAAAEGLKLIPSDGQDFGGQLAQSGWKGVVFKHKCYSAVFYPCKSDVGYSYPPRRRIHIGSYRSLGEAALNYARFAASRGRQVPDPSAAAIATAGTFAVVDDKPDANATCVADADAAGAAGHWRDRKGEDEDEAGYWRDRKGEDEDEAGYWRDRKGEDEDEDEDGDLEKEEEAEQDRYDNGDGENEEEEIILLEGSFVTIADACSAASSSNGIAEAGPARPNDELLNENEEALCSICFDPLSDFTSGRTPCGHGFHHMCLLRWRRTHEKASCPECRRPLARSSKRLFKEDQPAPSLEARRLAEAAEVETGRSCVHDLFVSR